MNTHTVNRDQKNARHRVGKPVGGRGAHIPGYGQGRAHERSVGNINKGVPCQNHCVPGVRSFVGFTTPNVRTRLALIAIGASHPIPMLPAGLPGEQVRRVILPVALRPRARFALSAVVARANFRRYSAGTLSFNLRQHSTRQSSNAAEGHCVPSFALSHEQTCRAKEFVGVRTTFQEDRNVFCG
jgi:hypothetical protein